MNTEMIKNIDILYGFAFYDHIPLTFDLCLPVNLVFDSSFERVDTRNEWYICWDKVDAEAISTYKDNLESISICLWSDVLSCNTEKCRNASHF